MIIINHEKVEPNKFWVKMDAQFFFAQMSDDARLKRSNIRNLS